MLVRRFARAFSIALFLLLSDHNAYGADANSQKDWTLNLKDVDISVFLEQVSSITGDNFVVDPTVKGKVSVVATTPMKAEAVHELLLSVLRVNGLAAVSAGATTRIVPLGNVRLGTGSSQSDAGQQIVTRVIPLKGANVSDTVRILKPLVSQSGYMEGSEYSNAIIVSDYGDNVSQILKALKALDKQQSASDVEVIPLKQVWVGNIVPLIEEMAPIQLEDSGKSHNRMRVLADERNNSIIVRGDKYERAEIRKLVEKFDVENEQASNIQMIHLQYADAKEVAALLRGMLGEKGIQSSVQSGTANPASAVTGQVADSASTFQSAIQANVTLNTIVVRTEPAMMNEIKTLVKQLDVRRPQVLIEAAIVEITEDKNNELGIQLAGGKTAVTYNGGTTQFSGAGLSIGDVLSQLGSSQAGNISSEGLSAVLGTRMGFNVLLQALSSTAGANLLSTPSIITLDNEEAKIVVGQNVPFKTGSFSTQNAGVTNPFTTIERQDIGITLKVVPQIHEGNLVKLGIEQEVSSIAPSTAQSTGAADIITNKRTIQTKVLAQDGETIVLGGLIEDDTSEQESKVPLLGDIPIAGSLFSSKSHTSTKKNLLVFLRPTVLRGSVEMTEVAQKRYSQVYEIMLGKQSIEDEIADQRKTTPEAGNVFEMPPKKLPWIIGGIGGGESESPVIESGSETVTQLPWLQPTSQTTPISETEIPPANTTSNSPITLTTP